MALRLGILKPLVAGVEAAEMSVIVYQDAPRTADDGTQGDGPEPGKLCPVYG